MKDLTITAAYISFSIPIILGIISLGYLAFNTAKECMEEDGNLNNFWSSFFLIINFILK